MDYTEWQEGTILVAKYRNEGTWCQFYMVTRRTPKTVWIVRLNVHAKYISPREWEGTPTDMCKGADFKRTLSKYGVRDEDNYALLKKWDGKPVYCTHNY